MENIAGFISECFHQINGTIHQGKHLGIGPPIPIAFCAAITCKRKGWTNVHEQNIFEPRLAKEICSGNARDSCAADNHIGGATHFEVFSLSSCHEGSTNTEPSGKMIVGTLLKP